MTRRRTPDNVGLAAGGTVLVHAAAAAALIASAAGAKTVVPPMYRVHLVAAPDAAQETRKAPEAVQREAAAPPPPAPAPPKRQPASAVSHAPPPQNADAQRREAAARTTAKVQPLPGEKPSTGNDVATVSTEGVEFPFPEYLQNIVSQILRRWQRPQDNTPLDAEVSFFVHRDGSITDLQFVKRSGNFAFDLEAQGAVEEAGRFKAFGGLPSGWPSDVLFVRFYFSGQRQ